MTAVPKKCKKPCKHPGCPNLTDGLYCAEHQPLHPDRPSAAKRGYGSKWQRLSKAYLRRHPLCVRCKAQGRFTAATVVDHIIPHRGDPHLMWDESNWQALCKSCHDHKTWFRVLPFRVPRRQDHPRLCGEKLLVYTPKTPYVGSPPPMRGKVKFKTDLFSFSRITPAYAGKSTQH